MTNSKSTFTPLCEDSAEPSHLEKFVGLEVVAKSNGDAANGKLFERKYPEHGTQPARLLAWLMKGMAITPLVAWDALGIYRLAAVVHTLKKDYGWPVQNRGLRVISRFGEETCVGFYKLAAADIESAGEYGIKYAEDEVRFLSVLEGDEKRRQGER